jgi:hypothetical protein
MKKFALVSLAPGDEVLAPTSNGSVLEEPEYMKLAGSWVNGKAPEEG